MVVKRVALGIAGLVGEEGHGGVHDAHVIDEEDNDVGLGGGVAEGPLGEDDGREEGEEAFHG